MSAQLARVNHHQSRLDFYIFPEILEYRLTEHGLSLACDTPLLSVGVCSQGELASSQGCEVIDDKNL